MIDLDYHAGFCRVRRSVFRALRTDAPTLQVWLELEDRARYSNPGPMPGAHGRIVDLDIGQAVFGRQDLARTLAISEERVKTAIKRLIQLGLIAIHQATKTGTVVTLIGYKESLGHGSAQPPTQAPSQPPTTHLEATSNKTEIRSGDLDLLSADPSSRPPGDLGSARFGPKSAAVVEPNGLSAWEESQRIARGEPVMPGLRLLQGGGDS